MRDERSAKIHLTVGGIHRRWLLDRRLPYGAALAAMILTLPSLGVGWVMDDHVHRMKMLGPGQFEDVIGESSDLFTFFDGDPARTLRTMDVGILPWWTFEEIKASLWRPLTVLTHRLDYLLWPNHPSLMHAHSILWFGGTVLAVSFFYRKMMGSTWVAGLASVLYAIDDARAMPVGFLANRNALLAALFGVLALWVHDRWRRDGLAFGALLGATLFALSLLSKEAGVAVGGYLIAYALFLDSGGWKRRLAGLLPYGVVFAIWAVAWRAQGYGVWGIDLYVDPIAETPRYLAAVLHRAPLLLLGQWALPPSELAVALPDDMVRWLWGGAVVFLVGLAVVLTPLLRRDKLARFWAMGMILSLPPICATFPADRLLFFVGIGAAGLLATFLGQAFERKDWSPGNRIRRVVLVALGSMFVLVHLVLAPIGLLLRSTSPVGRPSFLAQLHVNTPLDDSVAGQDVVLINPPVTLAALYLPLLRALDEQPPPRHTRALAPGFHGMTIHRPDERTLVIRPNEGFLDWCFDRIVRGDQHPMFVGQRVELTGMAVEVTALTDKSRPAEAVFTFDVPLEDSTLRWLYWRDGSFNTFTPPGIGETVELPPAMPKL